MKGYRVGVYRGGGVVYHSHNYTVAQEFKRYFDLGVFFEKQRWLLDEFGRPEGEGSSLCGLSYPILGLTGFFTCSQSV